MATTIRGCVLAAASAALWLAACGLPMPITGGCRLTLRQDGAELAPPYVARLTTRVGEVEEHMVGMTGEFWTDPVTVAVAGGNGEDEYTIPAGAFNAGQFEMRLEHPDVYQVVASDQAGCRAEFSIDARVES